MNLQNLKSDVHFLCGSTSANYPDADMIRNINIEYQNVARLIWTSAGGWQFDDANATSTPKVTMSLSANKQDYTLPTTIQRVEEVVVQDVAGDWVKLKPFDIHDIDIAPEEFQAGGGLPKYYDLIGNTIMLYPIPTSEACTLSSGMSIYISRDVTEFELTATTTVPGFATPFHRILSYAAAIDFVQTDSDRQMLVQMKDRLEQGLINFYSKRAVEGPTAIKPHAKSGWRRYQ